MSVPEEWVERAKYDIETARAMHSAGRYLYVVFCCQQAIEKALKAIIAQQTHAMPPRLHNLPRLAERAELSADDEQMRLLRRLSNYYVESRYPEELARMSTEVGTERARQVLKETEEMLTWLLSLVE